MKKRVFLIVLDSLGIGELPDADLYGDKGANTLKSVYETGYSEFENLKKLGLFNIDGIDYVDECSEPLATIGRLGSKSKGKDTTIGHWEITGIISETPLPTYPNGFPQEIVDEFRKRTGKNILCNAPYSGTDVIRDFGDKHFETGDLIIYTSADSVFQIAAHEEIVPLEKLYEYCEIAREILHGEHGVGRVIARPFNGVSSNFKRTSNRHDYSLVPKDNLLTTLENKKFDVIGVGKIYDIFAGKGITKSIKTQGNTDGIEKIYQMLDTEFHGLCFINLVDFDMLYGHRNDALGYAKALDEFDKAIPVIIEKMSKDDIVIITADHGCDPGFKGTDHSREYVPFIYFDRNSKPENLGTLDSFSEISKIIESVLCYE